jgi:simple sugar transport system substrate-binding protein
MTFRKTVAALAATTALVLGGTAYGEDKDHDWSGIDILMLHWSQASNPFFEAVNNGGKDAAAQQGITLDIQYGEEDPVNETTILETAIANKVDAIVVGIADDNAYDDVLCRAAAAGIVVLTINIDDSKGAEGGICRLAFMGQDFVETG